MEELIEVVAKKPILHDQLGAKQKGQKFKVTPRQLKQLQALGVIEIPVAIYQTKVVTDSPLLGHGEVQPSSASPVAQASQQTTAEPSKRGRGRPRKSGE